MKIIEKGDYTAAVRISVFSHLTQKPDDLFGIQAVVGYDIGASEEQVRYAVRVLRMNGLVEYDKKNGKYHLTHHDPRKGAE